MQSKNFQSGVLTSAAAVALTLVVGESYGLIIGTEASNFNGQSITPKLSTGANSGAAAQGTLTIDTQPTNGDTITLGGDTYTFVENGQSPSWGRLEVELGADLAETKVSLVAAINGDYFDFEANRSVTAGDFAGDDSVLTAIATGTTGNEIVTTETFTEATNIFDGTTLGTTTAGTDSFDDIIAIPEPSSADSAGSAQAFLDEGMIEFGAILPELVLVPSGAVTSVAYYLTRLETNRKTR